MLLRAVVEVALDPPPLRVRGRDDASPGGSKLLGLLVDPSLESLVPLGQLGCLGLDGVVVVLDPDERADPGQELLLIEGLPDEVVRVGLEGVHSDLGVARGDHHHRQKPSRRVGPQPPAHLVAVHPGHLDVEEHEVRQVGSHPLERLRPRRGGGDRVAVGAQDGLEETDVPRNVIDHQDLRARVRAHLRAHSTSLPAQ